MKAPKLIFITFFSILLNCCTIPNNNKTLTNRSNSQGNEILVNITSNNISSEVAEFIAIGFSYQSYELKRYNTTVENFSTDIWEVKFIGKEKLPKGSCCGGYDFSVFVSKKNGEITRATIGK